MGKQRGIRVGQALSVQLRGVIEIAIERGFIWQLHRWEAVMRCQSLHSGAPFCGNSRQILFDAIT